MSRGPAGRPRRRSTAATETRPGRVIRHQGRGVLVEDDSGRQRPCHLRRRLGRVVCGDRVRWQPSAAGQGVVIAIEPRHNLLQRGEQDGRSRPLAANIDQVLVVTAAEPPPSEPLLDRYLVACETLDAEAVLVMNKVDLLTEGRRAGLERRLTTYTALGYPLLWLSARDGGGLESLRAALAGRTSILVGQSGVGKSSLIQALLPGEAIRTGALSEATGLGRHTTTETTLYHLPRTDDTGPAGGLIDSPGVRDFQPGRLNAAELAHGFREFRLHLGHCRFNDCRHLQEPDCAVLRALDAGAISEARWNSYRTLLLQGERLAAQSFPAA